MSEQRTLTQAELLTEAKERFGADVLDIAFQCPGCGDIAALREFPEDQRGHAGQECIGRYLGALTAAETKRGKYDGRGCDWVAYGLIRGPWKVTTPDGPDIYSFPLADAPVRAS